MMRMQKHNPLCRILSLFFTADWFNQREVPSLKGLAYQFLKGADLYELDSKDPL
jgi:hypothetical protein